MTVYRPTRAVRASLFRVGDLTINAIDGTPDQYADTRWNALVPVADPVRTTPTPAFSHPEAIGTILSTYDDVILDTRPRVTSAGKVTSNWTTEPYRLMQLYERPFWLVVRCDGYGETNLQTAEKALEVALAVMRSMWADALNYQLTKSIAGFAIVQPNLNVIFPDGSAITRTFQSRLVQEAWTLGRPAMIITTRPFDVTTTIGPEIVDNPNSKQPLSFPILGNNPVHRDRLVAMYPEVMTEAPNASILLAHFNAFRTLFKMDRVTPLNIDCGMLLRHDPSDFVLDGTVGASSTDTTAYPRLRDVVSFLAALGVTNVGFQVGPDSVIAPVPPQWLPTRSNTSGSWSQVWSGEFIKVEYLGTLSDGTAGIVQRVFTHDLVEMTGE